MNALTYDKQASNREAREFFDARRKPPLERFFNGEDLSKKKYDATFMNTIGHEFNHLIAAYRLNVPLHSMTLTAIPEGDILGKVTLPDHIDLSTLQVIAMAGSVAAHDGQARGYGSDVYKAQLIAMFGGGKSVGAARQEAESLVTFYTSDVRAMCAKIIAFLQTEGGLSEISGDMLPEIERRARYELELKNDSVGQSNKTKTQMPVFFKEPTIAEKTNQNKPEDTNGRPPDRRTIIEYLPNNQCLINIVTDDVVENTVPACSICYYPSPEHAENCSMKQQIELEESTKKLNRLTPGTKQELIGHRLLRRDNFPDNIKHSNQRSRHRILPHSHK